MVEVLYGRNKAPLHCVLLFRGRGVVGDPGGAGGPGIVGSHLGTISDSIGLLGGGCQEG